MRRLAWGICGLCLLAPVAAWGQFFAPAPGWGWGWGNGPATAASAYQHGMAAVVRSAGEANLMNSMAAQNYEAARSQDIQNRLQWTESYYEMRRANREYRASKRTPRLSHEEIVRIARQGLPRRLTSEQLDPLTGEVNWPIILREKQYDSEREELDKLFSERASMVSMKPNVYRAVKTTTDQLLAALRANIKEYSPNDWLGARRFVESLAYEVRFPAG